MGGQTFTVDMPGVLADHVADMLEAEGGPGWAAFQAGRTIWRGRGYTLRITGTREALDDVSLRAEALLKVAGTGEVSAAELRGARVWLARAQLAVGGGAALNPDSTRRGS